jgi:hypothetical protein
MAKTKTKRVRWECPNGEHPGVLGSTRPPKDSIVRYCLPCSEATGRLVERVAPALERKRAAKTAARKSKAQRKRERELAKQREWPNVLHLIFAQVKKLKCWRTEVKHATLNLRYSKTRRGAPGHANYTGRITMTAGSNVGGAIETLMHELAHVAFFERYGLDNRDWHGTRFYGILFEASRELLGAEYTERIRATAREKNDGRVSAPALDAELTKRFNQAITAGVFSEFVTETTIKAPEPKRRGAELEPGVIEFSIPHSIQVVLKLDDEDAQEWRRECPELELAYGSGHTYRGGTIHNYVKVWGPPLIIEQMMELLRQARWTSESEYRAGRRLFSKLANLRREARQQGGAVANLFAAMGKLA